MAENLGGRPTKATPELVAKLIAAFELKSTVNEAVEYAQIDVSTFYRWMKEDAGFAQKIADARELVNVVAKGNIASKIFKGDVPTSQWWLERKKKDEFSTRSEMTGADGEKLEGLVVIKNATDKPL